MWTIFKVFIEFITIFFVLGLVSWLQGMWELRSLTKDEACTPCIGMWSFNHWTAREVPRLSVWMPDQTPQDTGYPELSAGTLRPFLFSVKHVIQSSGQHPRERLCVFLYYASLLFQLFITVFLRPISEHSLYWNF